MTVTFRPRTVVITGGAGFIGSALVRYVLAADASVCVVNLDALTYAGSRANLDDVNARHGPSGDARHSFLHGDIRDEALVAGLLAGEARAEGSGARIAPPDAVLHLAAESHVDRSIAGPAQFISTNVLGTFTLLEAVRRELAERPRAFRFINVSTDEVYGSLTPSEPPFDEAAPIRPSSPYSASKAAADGLVRSYRQTYDLPCLTTRGSNTYGPRQYPEKLIPLMITRALEGKALPVYGDGMQVRDWIHVDDHAAAIWAVCTRGDLTTEAYNVGATTERTNLDVVRTLLELLGRPASLIAHVADRPGHDRRCALDTTRIRTELGWKPVREFAEGLADTVRWYADRWDPERDREASLSR